MLARFPPAPPPLRRLQVRSLVAQPEQPRQLSWPRLGADVARRASAVTQLVRSWVGGGGSDPAVLSAHGARVMILVSGRAVGGL